MFKKKKTGKTIGSSKGPTFDPYKRWSGFGGTGFLKKDKGRNLIMPGVTWYEENRLKGIKDSVAEKTEKDCTIPQHLINDVYSMYVNEDIKRRPVNDSNKIKQKVLDKVYNSLTKIVTKDSPMFSQIVTKELAFYLQKIEEEIKEEMEKNGQGGGGESPFDHSEEGDGSGQGQGDRDGDKEGEDFGGGKKATKDRGTGKHGDLDDKIDDILNSSKNEKELQDAFDRADKITKDLKDKLGEDVLKDLADSNEDFLKQIDKIKGALERVAVNKESIKQVLSKILDESMNYFSAKYHTMEESIFETEDFDDLFGLEFLHPIFRNAELESAGNATRIYKGKIDLYLDCSGSMGSTETFEGTRIRMIDLVKGIAMVLYRMNMIDKLYFFDGQIYEIKNINEFTILGFNKSGGTNFDNVVTQCIKNKTNSVIITDGEDNCSMFAKNTFWIGVGGTQFRGYGSDNAFNTYKANRQCVTYNSNGGKFDYVT